MGDSELDVLGIEDDTEDDGERKSEDVRQDLDSDKAPAVNLVAILTTESEPQLDISLDSVHKEDLRYMNIGGNFFTGVDVTSEDAIRKREERAKRFGIKEEQSHPPPSSDHEVELDVAKLEARSKRFGTELLLANGQPVKFVGSLPPVPAGRLRHRAVHLHGLDEMSTEDVFQFFSLYGPRNIEWLNDQSCNAVWEDEVSAKRALIGLGLRPLAIADDKESLAEETVQGRESGSSEDESVRRDGCEGEGEGVRGEQDERRGEGEGEGVRGEQDERRGEEVRGESELDERRGEEVRGESEQDERRGEGEGEGVRGEQDERRGEGEGEGERQSSNRVQWWLAPPHSRAQQLLLRPATTGDVKKPGSAGKSRYYRKYGNPNEPTMQQIDLRGRLGRKRLHPRGDAAQLAAEEGEGEEQQMEVDRTADPLASLVKCPKTMHADRDEDDEGERHGGRGEGGGEETGGVDLRKTLKKKRKRRDLQMRLGHYPRLVEEHT